MFKIALSITFIVAMIGLSAEARKASKKREEAKQICLVENPSFTKKELKKCIKQKVRRS